LAAVDLEVDVVRAAPGSRRDGRLAGALRSSEVRGEARRVAELLPLLHPRPEDERVPVRHAVLEVREDLLRRHGTDLMSVDRQVPAGRLAHAPPPESIAPFACLWISRTAAA